MKNNELIQRYIYAVTKRLPRKSQEDVARELESLISDMLEEATGGLEPTEKEVRVVLTKLGSPRLLAASYHPDQAGLIPQPYYNQYLMVLPVVLAAVSGGIAIALVLAAFFDGPSTLNQLTGGNATETAASIGKLVGGILGGIFEAALQAFFWVTLIFAIIARRGISLDGEKDFLDTLPEIPQNRKPIGKGGPIVGIVFSVAFSIVMLTIPQVIFIINTDYSPNPFPVFNLELMARLWPAILLIGLTGIISNCMTLIEGQYTKRLLVVNLACNLVFVVCAVIWLGDGSILSTEYREIMGSILSGETVPNLMMQNLNLLVLGAIFLGVIIDTIESIYTTFKK